MGDGFRYRERDLQRLEVALAGDVSVITVLGPGGSGKTTLVRQLDVPFVDLSACRTVADVAAAVERRIGVAPAEASGPVVLDNCEQIPGLGRAVATWLEPGTLRVVATSRVPLQLTAEQRIRLDRLDDADAADLFVRRAAQHGAHLTLDAVAPLVARLEGLPLAVELCASRAASLGVARVSELLDRPLEVLSDRKADRPARHGSLERTLAWSWELLSDAARATLRQLALHGEPFALEDCDWVVVDGLLDDAVEELVEASLLEPSGASGRFRVLDSVRAFALGHTGGDDRARFRAALRSREATAERVPEAVLAFRDAVEDDPDEAVRIALWIDPVLTRTGPLPLRMEIITAAQALRPDDVRLRLRTAHAHMTRGEVERAATLLDGLDTHSDPEVAVEAVAAQARLASNQHDMPRARELWDRALRGFRALGDLDGVARALSQRANFDKGLGDLAAARTGMEEALQLARERGDRRGAALAAAHLGTMAHDRGELDVADRYMADAQSVFEALGFTLRVADLTATRAIVALERGELDVAEAGIQQAMDVHDELGAPRWLGWYRVLLAVTRFLQGRRGEAERAVRPAVTEMRAYTLPGSAEIAVLFGCLLVEDAALTGVWRDEVAERAARIPFSPVMQAAIEVVDASRDPSALRELEARLNRPADGLPAIAYWSNEVRLMLRVALERCGARDFSYGDGWFETPAGERVDLRTRGALRRILAALVARRDGSGLSMEEVFEAGWPGQSIHPDAAGNRVYTAIAALRKMGLHDVLVRHDDGYRLVRGGALET